MTGAAALLRRTALIGMLAGLLSGFSGPRGGIGGTGVARGGIGGTGITAVGVIQRFGSIYVNGTEYLLSTKTHYRVDGRRANIDALHRGQGVFVDAIPHAGHPVADKVRVQHALIGLVQTVTADGRRLRILGQDIHVSPRALARLERTDHVRPTRGMDLAVSAGSPASGRWIATRIRTLPAPHGRSIRFLIRGTLHTVIRHHLRLANRTFPWAGSQVPKALVGHPVVAQGHYRFGHPIVTSVRPATGLQHAQSQIFIAAYLRRAQGSWRFDGQTLIARGHPSPKIARGPAFLAIRREGADRFVVLRAIPDIHIMSVGLRLPGASAAVRPHVTPSILMRPHVTRPTVTRPQFTRPILSRPETAPRPSSPP